MGLLGQMCILHEAEHFGSVSGASQFHRLQCRGTKLVLLCREDAVRLGFFIGGFTGSYHLLTAALNKWRGDKPAQNCMAAGTAAGQLITQLLQTVGVASMLEGSENTNLVLHIHSLATPGFLQSGTLCSGLLHCASHHDLWCNLRLLLLHAYRKL